MELPVSWRLLFQRLNSKKLFCNNNFNSKSSQFFKKIGVSAEFCGAAVKYLVLTGGDETPGEVFAEENAGFFCTFLSENVEEICIVIGASGLEAFVKGIEKSGMIVAINSDKDALIFNCSDYGIVQKYQDFVRQYRKEVSSSEFSTH